LNFTPYFYIRRSKRCILGVNARDVGPRGLVSPSKSIFSDLGLCLGSLGLKLNEAEGKAYEDFLIVNGMVIWNGTFRGGSLFSWIGNFFRLPQGVVDIPGTWHLLPFDGIFVLCKLSGSRISAPLDMYTTHPGVGRKVRFVLIMASLHLTESVVCAVTCEQDLSQ